MRSVPRSRAYHSRPSNPLVEFNLPFAGRARARVSCVRATLSLLLNCRCGTTRYNNLYFPSTVATNSLAAYVILEFSKSHFHKIVKSIARATLYLSSSSSAELASLVRVHLTPIVRGEDLPSCLMRKCCDIRLASGAREATRVLS